MTREVILGNGNMLICLDKDARIRDFYYPYIGQENHVSSRTHRIGIWVNGSLSWVSAEEWELSIGYEKDSLVSNITAFNRELKVKLVMRESVYPGKNIYLRQLSVENKDTEEKEIKVFFSQQFQISESNIGDTAYYDPLSESIVHYKGRRYFLIGGLLDGEPFSDYATGEYGVGGKKGTYLDAEDGFLSKNAIEHGSVDSTISFTLFLKKHESRSIDYWIAVGKDHGEVSELNNLVLTNTLPKMMKETAKYWEDWLEQNKVNFHRLKDDVRELFKRSLMIVRAQTDNNGAIIASNDTHTFRFKEDTYSYMWPRDGALIARSFDKTGYYEITHRFFEFCSRVISKNGYLLPKYRPDGSVGSSWHSWLKNNKLQLPIQEDETALVLDALWKHYQKHKDAAIRDIYASFIKRAADFLVSFRHEKTGLPRESYDLWEEKLGVHTFTCSTVHAGLKAAEGFAKELGDSESRKKYERAAEEIKKGILKHLFDKEEGRFIKRFYYDSENRIVKDKTIDMSTVYGLFEYKVLDVSDPKVVKTMEQTMKRLWCITPCGGVSRYENDHYYRINDEAPENPWFISTFWLAEYYIARAKNVEDLKPAEELLEWATERALPSGVMSEQLNPYTGEPLSVAPLTWSHAGFIIAVIKYLEKFEKLKSH